MIEHTRVETIMCFDPGGTTGIALYDITHGIRTEHIGPDVHHLFLWHALLKFHPDVVIYEQFIYQRRPLDKGVALEIISREYIGIVRLYAAMMNIPCIESSLTKLAFWDDEKLKLINLWSNVIHERDALRHLLYYLTFDLKDLTWVNKLAS